MFRGSELKLAKLLVAFALVQRFFVSAELLVGEVPAPMPYSGDIWRRSTLTGDWGGLRNELAVKGVPLDLDITQVGQGVVGGGKSGAWEYGGRGDFILDLDSGKLGLWPGGFFYFLNGRQLGAGVYKKNWALMAGKNKQLFSLPPGGFFGVLTWDFTQFSFSYFWFC